MGKEGERLTSIEGDMRLRRGGKEGEEREGKSV